jgi:hypothetical protein
MIRDVVYARSEAMGSATSTGIDGSFSVVNFARVVAAKTVARLLAIVQRTLLVRRLQSER